MNRCPAILVSSLAGLILVSCVEERIVRSTDLLAGLPGAEGGTVPVRPGTTQGQSWDQLLAQFGGPQEQATWEPAQGQHLREVSKRGEIRLISRSPGHVMFHLTQTLRGREYDLLLEQVLSERTKQSYRDRDRDPMEAVAYLKRYEQSIAALFAALPLGEQTPGVLMENLGNNAFRLRAPQAIAADLRFDRFDVVIENGSFRLLMIR